MAFAFYQAASVLRAQSWLLCATALFIVVW